MDPQTRLQADQLARMRGMTRYYHERFFADVRLSLVAELVLFAVGFWQVPEAFALIPVVALFGATMTAFDASYLLFARHYARRLESDLNARLEQPVLIASQIEDAYLFPLDQPKMVVAAFGAGFTWFSFMTIFITALGVAAYGFGAALSVPVLLDHGAGWLVAYWSVVGSLTVAALGVGWWWFVSGVGERRLRSVIER